VIYPSLLKADYDKLPLVLREFHAAAGERRATGKVAIRHERPWLARLVGFPAAGNDILVRLQVAATENEEVWTRWFGDSKRRTIQWAAGDFLVEKAGPVRIDFHIFADESGMRFESKSASLWGISVPLRIDAWARGAGGAWEIEVTVAHVGSYRGVMAPAS
jgi:hypothetical protein